MSAIIKALFSAPEPEGAVAMTPAELRKFNREGIRVVIGAALIHVVLGCFYLWGGVSLYVASYLIQDDPNIDVDLVKMVFPFMNLTLCFGMPFGVKLAEKIGPKVLEFFGVLSIALLTFITSYIKSFYAYLVLYGLGVGLVSGLMYVVAYNFGWKYFPHRKGVVTGSVLAGYGFGSLIFNYIALSCVNPNNMKASVKVGKSTYFTHEVYDNVPYMMRILALSYLLFGLAGWLLLKTPKVVPLRHHAVPQPQAQRTESAVSHKTSDVEVVIDAKTGAGSESAAKDSEFYAKISQTPSGEANPLAITHQATTTETNILPKEAEQTKPAEPIRYECTSLTQGFKTLPFWLLFLMAFFGTFYGFLIANNYKVYGLARIGDDTFVTTVGSIGSAFNGCSRIFWAGLLDKYGYKKVFFFLMAVQIIIVGTFDPVSDIKALFLIWYSISMFCEGGILAMEPAVTGKIFGAKKGSLIYGFVFFGMALANLCGFFLTKFATDLSWADIFWICFAFSCVAFVVNLLFNQYYKFGPPKNAKTEKVKTETLAVKV